MTKSEGILTCYAESADGIKWEKPDLGLVSWRGSRRNNILFDAVTGQNARVIVDRKPRLTNGTG